MTKQYTWTNSDGLTLGGGRNSPDSDRGEVSTKVDLTETEVASVQALVSGGGIGAPMLVAKTNQTFSRASANVAGDSTMGTLTSFTVPGGSMGPNGSLLFEVEHQYTSSVAAKSVQFFVGATAITPEVTLSASTTNDNWRHALHNTSETAQKYRGSRVIQGGNSTGFTTTAIDTSVDFVVDCKCRWGGATASETISITSLRAVVEYGA